MTFTNNFKFINRFATKNVFSHSDFCVFLCYNEGVWVKVVPLSFNIKVYSKHNFRKDSIIKSFHVGGFNCTRCYYELR